ncbi:MAG: hypothetical protein B6I18_09155 [Bacteroidetes bacterium 4572_112]|nr:MAG: hypothetical protein B6I18_09155 [Bacteroidetes bacterium 4572_112]
MYNWQGKNIVIADDDYINIELLNLMIRVTKANIHMFENGQQVVDFISNNDADIIILDIQMPVLDGFKTSIKLREMKFKGKIFALTAFNTFDNMATYTDCKFDEIIEKPIRRKELLKIISKHI